MRIFDQTGDNLAARFGPMLESALLARALADTGGSSDERAKALLGQWMLGTFNAASVALGGLGSLIGYLDWEPDGAGQRLVWYSPAGVACPLARLYEQPDGMWAALIVAGVKDDLLAAMAAAEWGVSRLVGE